MNLVSTFLTSIYSLMILSSLMLMASEGSAFPTVLSIPVAFIAMRSTDRGGRWYLSTFWSNMAAFAGIGLAVGELVYGEVSNNLESRIISGAHLLVYLNWVVVLQRKNTKQYWWICSLSVLQIAIGSVLTMHGWYGGLMFVYFFLAIWTLSVFSLYQASQRLADERLDGLDEGNSVPDPRIPSASNSGGLGSHVTPASLLQLSRSPGPSIQKDINESWVSRRFAGGTVLSGFGAIMIGAFFFMFVPRFWIGKPPFSNEAVTGIGGGLTGFSSEVRLGAFGDILESTEQVLQARVFDGSEEIPIEQYAERLGQDEPLFRGLALMEYSEGKWAVGSLGGRLQYSFNRNRDRMLRDSVKQEIQLKAIGANCLFALHPLWTVRATGSEIDVTRNPATGVVNFTAGDSQAPTVQYTVWSPKTAEPGLVSNSRDTDLDYQLFLCRRLPTRGLENLRLLAESLTEGVSTDRERAQQLKHHLVTSGEYRYSLRMDRINEKIDPVEDFLFNRRQGHCEYFASAMALMLRAVGIPSRIITGFKGGVRNSVTGHFEVQQRHAHAWVEAHLDGRWITLDATPSGRAESVKSLEPTLKTWADLRGYVSEFWSKWVLGVSFQNQQRQVYDPALQSFRQLVSALKGNEASMARLKRQLREFFSSPDKWFSWQGGLITLVLALLILAAIWILKRLAGLVRSWRKRRSADSAQRRAIVFFDRFVAECSRRGINRRPSETYWEFARHSRISLQPWLETNGLADLPDRVVSGFVAVRFGGKQLPQDLESALMKDIRRFAEAAQHSGADLESEGAKARPVVGSDAGKRDQN